jgi:2-polyprenyl-3-methyl-5-hydroxy-6-metoxy-1,4-benzoquinol methylase
MRQASLWYVGFVTHQVSQFSTAVSRALHLLDEQVAEIGRQLDAQRVPPAPVVQVAGAHGADAWWVAVATEALAGVAGRVLQAAAADGWLVRHLAAAGFDAYGVDPRPEVTEYAEREGTDLRHEAVADHLRAVAPAALGAVILTGVVDGMAAGEREQLLDLLEDRLAPEGVLVVHSLSPSAWTSLALTPEADLAPGRPLRPATWVHLLVARGFSVAVWEDPEAVDYLVAADRSPEVATHR